MATRAVTVMTLRSRLDRPGRSHISPNRTFSVRSASFGATSPILSLVVGSDLSFVIDSPDVQYLQDSDYSSTLKLYHYRRLTGFALRVYRVGMSSKLGGFIGAN